MKPLPARHAGRRCTWNGHGPDGAPSGLRGEAHTLLHALAWSGEHRALRRLARRGANLDVVDDAGETPLHGAAAWGRATTVRALLRLGASVDVVEPIGGFAPLHWAASHGHAGVVRALLRAGADAGRRDRQGRTPAELAEATSTGARLLRLLQAR